jgi:hypothetical protein
MANTCSEVRNYCWKLSLIMSGGEMKTKFGMFSTIYTHSTVGNYGKGRQMAKVSMFC